jgi:hypothetical protein
MLLETASTQTLSNVDAAEGAILLEAEVEWNPSGRNKLRHCQCRDQQPPIHSFHSLSVIAFP